jgi:hypothetical protein
MTILVRATALATALAALACSSPLDLPRDLLGRWATAPEAYGPSVGGIEPHAWYQFHLTFASTGSYQSEWRGYGFYAGQAPGELSSLSREEGGFRTAGDRLALEAHRLVLWDHFSGDDSPETVLEPYPYGTVQFDGARFAVIGHRLILHYVAAGPLDEPVPTTREYHFVR